MRAGRGRPPGTATHPAGRDDRPGGRSAAAGRHRAHHRSIARRLVISPKTADSHIQHIYAKIGCSTRGAAVLFALRHNLAG